MTLDEVKLVIKEVDEAVAAEREACAIECERIDDYEFYKGSQYADMIRARGQA